MKKKLFALAAAVALVGGVLPIDAKAADRVTKNYKVCRYDFSAVAADAMLTLANGQGYCDLTDIIPERITLESNLTAITGTNVIFKAVSTSDPSNIAGATTDPPLLGSDGSTALVSATLTATGRASKGTSVPVAGTSGVGMNLGTKIGVWADVSSATVSGTVWVVIVGRPNN